VDEVRRLRLEKGWSQNELAYHAKLAPSVISLIETGKRDPNATTLRKLAGALEVRIPDLFEGRDSRKAQRRSSPEPRLFNSLDERCLSRFSEAIIAAAARWGEAMSSPDMNDTKRFGLIDAALDLSRVIEERAEEEDWEALPNQERLEIVTTMEKLIEAANQGLRHLEESGRAKAQEVLVNQRREQMREWTRRISA
jgi:transcriptional regulator with XRE-family HTH domain